MAIAVPDELKESVGPGSEGRAWHARGRSVVFLLIIARADMPWSAVWRGWRRSMDTNRCHRASGCALERCLEGFAALDGHKSMPSRRRMCPVGPWKADSGAR